MPSYLRPMGDGWLRRSAALGRPGVEFHRLLTSNNRAVPRRRAAPTHDEALRDLAPMAFAPTGPRLAHDICCHHGPRLGLPPDEPNAGYNLPRATTPLLGAAGARMRLCPLALGLVLPEQ